MNTTETTQPQTLHERLDVLMGPTMKQFLDKLRAAYASGEPKAVFKVVLEAIAGQSASDVGVTAAEATPAEPGLVAATSTEPVSTTSDLAAEATLKVESKPEHAGLARLKTAIKQAAAQGLPLLQVFKQSAPVAA